MGMALSTSVAISKELNETMNNVTLKNMNSCVISNDANQSIVVNGNGNIVDGIQQIQHNKASMSCFVSAENQSKLMEQLANKLAQTANSSVVNWPLGFNATMSLTDSTTVNKTLNNYHVENISKCKGDFNDNQSLEINGDSNHVYNTVQNQWNDNALKCVFNAKNISDISETLANDVHQKAESKIEGVNVALVMAEVIVVIIVIVIAAYIIFRIIKSRQNNPRKPPPQPRPRNENMKQLPPPGNRNAPRPQQQTEYSSYQ